MINLQSEGGKIRKLSSTVQLSDPEDYEGGHFDYIEYQGIFDKLDIYDTRIDIGNFKKSIPFSAKTKGTLIVFAFRYISSSYTCYERS